ncbi:hypothetical protein [Georgenia sp. SUBG003]|uniref:hypothetical protein n=1 Tax=Georgenia sp. SUBG003 TaxID=1497974 RepID=UPI003AB5D0F5
MSALVSMLTAQGAEDAGTSAASDAGGEDGQAAAGATDQPSTQGGGAASDGPADPGECSPRDLDVTMAAVPANGGPMTFDLTLHNGADVACLIDAGDTSLELTVHSGEDRVWSSADCVAEPTERELLLDAGDSAETTVRWDGSRSADGCPAGQGAAQPGSYRVSATLDGASLPAAATVFTLE